MKHFARPDSPKSCTNRLNCRSYRPVSQIYRNNDNDTDVEAGQVLLKPQPAIRSQQDIELFLCAAK
jgi:hypothetical protein